MNFVKKNWKGFLLCLVIAVPSWVLGKMFPIVGGPVIGILAGMVVTDIDKVSPNKGKCVISGKLVSDDNKPVDFATVSLEGTSYGGKFFTKPYF